MTWLRFALLSPGRKKAVIWVAAVWLLHTMLGFFILPLFVRAIAVKELSKRLDRAVLLQKVQINPYTLSATVRGLLVKDRDGEPLVSWDEAYVNFQWTSLLSRVWI